MCLDKTPANLSHFPHLYTPTLGSIQTHYRQQLISSNEVLTVNNTTTTYTSVAKNKQKPGTSQVPQCPPILYPRRHCNPRNNAMNNHKVMDMKHICSQCHRTYGHPSSLRRHVNSAHKNRRYQCKRCPCTYKRIENLKFYLRKHEDGTNPVTPSTHGPSDTANEVGNTCMDLLSTPMSRDTCTCQPLMQWKSP